MDSNSSKRDPRKVRSAEDFDILIGFFGFCALILFVVTLFLEVTGKPALFPAMILLVVALAMWGLIWLRRRLSPRTARRPR